MKWFLVLIALFAFTASAADITGSWKASIETPNGNFEQTFNLKADGAKLTGKVSSQMGDSDISNGKIDGDNVSFDVVRDMGGNEFKLSYKGKVTGNEMKLTFSFPGRDGAIEMTAKKVS